MAEMQITEPRTAEIKTISTYLLSSSDNPGLIISSVILKGDNYNVWAIEFVNALQAKRMLGFVNGNLKKPASDDPDFENWLAVNSMIVGWIRTSIKPKVRSTATYIPDAHQLWIELKNRFLVGNQVRLHQLKSQLATCRQDGCSLLYYFGKLTTLWEELQNYQPLITCMCSPAAQFAKTNSKENVHQFLMGLDDSRFGSLCTSIISTDTLPDLGEVYAKIIREEQKLEAVHSRDIQQSVVGFVTRIDGATTNSNQNNSILRDKRVVCTYCGKTGHEKKGYSELIGYPDWWNEKSRKQRKKQQSKQPKKTRWRKCNCSACYQL